MMRDRVRVLLGEVAAGRRTVDDALAQLDAAPVEDLSFAQIDHHRALRQGYPEVVFGEGKTPEQALQICERLAAHGDGFLVTRADGEMRAVLCAAYPAAESDELGRTVLLRRANAAVPAESGALIVTAGTGDLPVAQECIVALRAFGHASRRVADVGVAGIHRVLAQQETLRAARVVVVVAGMDGALPSVVGGMVRVPVIAVPTSVGYGASFRGLSALLTMLNSCAAGVVVCNIDNGFGAAVAASRILELGA
ncbi:MAG: 1-(5-phosphoribosyl)-5-amino-4-imidazole-carboxylate carboxylase [Gemmatimonas sp.]|nr:1-(5-phosphoribosyl)-5-amino-4-imidazole-carboxylate carboxylase [Gemmatimonas sp.]